jgi:BRO1-like domain
MNSLRKAKTTMMTTRGRGGSAAPSPTDALNLDSLALHDTRGPSRHDLDHRARPRKPPPPPALLVLGLPRPAAGATPAEVLAESVRRVTVARATDKRAVLVGVLQMQRGAEVVGKALAEYIAYATACDGIADGLRARNKSMPRDPFRWESALAARDAGEVVLNGGFAVDVVYVIFTQALLKLHVVLAPEGRTLLGSGDSAELMSASRELQLAAGMFHHVADVSIPHALRTLSQHPPPEMDDRVNRAMAQLCLAVAQCLVVRHAELSSFPPTSLVKLSLGARQLCTLAAEAAEACGPALAPAVAATGRELAQFMRAWSQRLLAADAAARLRVGEKTARARLALRYARALGSGGGVVGVLAAEKAAEYAETLAEFEGDARRMIEPEPAADTLGMRRLETKVIVQATAYDPPIAEVVKKTKK